MQFVIGDNLDKCREALTSKDADTLHLLDRINLDLQVQNSIVPSALSLAKIKVSGKLPSLSVNISDNKYKALMRVIDVSIPHLGEDVQTPVPPPVPQRNSGVFPLPPLGIFGPDRAAYNIDDDESEDESGSVDDQYFEADEGGIAVCPLFFIFRSDVHDLVVSIRSCTNTSLSSIFRSTN